MLHTHKHTQSYPIITQSDFQTFLSSPKRNSLSISSHFPVPIFTNCITTNLLSVHLLWTLYMKRIITIYDLFFSIMFSNFHSWVTCISTLFFLLLNSISLYRYITCCAFHPSFLTVNIWVASSLWLLWIMLLSNTHLYLVVWMYIFISW